MRERVTSACVVSLLYVDFYLELSTSFTAYHKHILSQLSPNDFTSAHTTRSSCLQGSQLVPLKK
jgi:hypothetical protein